MTTTVDRILVMIDKHINADTFSRITTQIHHDGIAKTGKSYKQHSHAALVAAFFNLIDHHNVATLLEIGAFQAEVSRRGFPGLSVSISRSPGASLSLK